MKDRLTAPEAQDTSLLPTTQALVNPYRTETVYAAQQLGTVNYASSVSFARRSVGINVETRTEHRDNETRTRCTEQHRRRTTNELRGATEHRTRGQRSCSSTAMEQPSVQCVLLATALAQLRLAAASAGLCVLATEPSSIAGRACVVTAKYVFHLRDEDVRTLQQDEQNWGNNGARLWDQAMAEAMGLSAGCEVVKALEMAERCPNAADHVDLLCHERLVESDEESELKTQTSNGAKMFGDEEIAAFLRDVCAEGEDLSRSERASRKRSAPTEEVITVPETSEDIGPDDRWSDTSLDWFRAAEAGEASPHARKRRRQE